MLEATLEPRQMAKQPGEAANSDFAALFHEIFDHAGRSHAKRARAIGVSRNAVVEKSLGTHVPSPYVRALTCIAVAALRRQPTEAERKAIVEEGLRLMRELEEQHDESE